VDRVYRQLKDILGITAVQQAMSSLQRWAKVSISSPDRSNASRQKPAMEPPVAGTISSLAQIPARVWSSHSDRRPELQACRQACGGGGTRTHSPSTMRGTHAGVDVMIGRDVAYVLRDRGQRRLKSMCMTHGSQNISKHRVTSSSTMTRQIQAFGRRTTTLHARWVGRTMTCSSFSCSPFT
jgi:hypothetical protein